MGRIQRIVIAALFGVGLVASAGDAQAGVHLIKVVETRTSSRAALGPQISICASIHSGRWSEIRTVCRTPWPIDVTPRV